MDSGARLSFQDCPHLRQRADGDPFVGPLDEIATTADFGNLRRREGDDFDRRSVTIEHVEVVEIAPRCTEDHGPDPLLGQIALHVRLIARRMRSSARVSAAARGIAWRSAARRKDLARVAPDPFVDLL
jgi:hypothetical protein